ICYLDAIWHNMNENKNLCCYFVTKHSWKGKYKRIFSVGTHGITTYNPTNLENTNQWAYNELAGIVPNFKAQANNEFLLNIKKGKKIDNMKFSSDHRADILTESLRFSNLFCEKFATNKLFNAFKQHWSETKKQVILEVSASCIFQREASTKQILANYDFKDIDFIAHVSDVPNGLVISNNGFNRLHLFQCEERESLLRCILDNSGNYVGIPVRFRKDPLTIDQFWSEKFGKFSADEFITSLAEFTVYKMSNRHQEPVRRLLCLSEACLLERDPASYSICTLKPLSDIFAIVRSEEDPQQFSIEYMRGPVRTYTSSDRDSLLASLLDGVRASGNKDVCIKMRPTKRGLRLGPFNATIDEEVESVHMKFLFELPNGHTLEEIMVRFNVNVPYSGLINAVSHDGLFAENKERLINNCLNSLKDFDPVQNYSAQILEQEFHVLRRLVASKSGYKAFTHLPKFREAIGRKIVRALRREELAVVYATIEFLNALMQPMHTDYDLKQEQLNKTSLLSSRKFLEGIMDILLAHIKKGTGALVIAALLDFLTYALCPPFSETTEGDLFDTLLEIVADNGRVFYKLFQHPSMAIVKGAGMIMKALIEEGKPELAARMQELSLSEGAMPRHLHTAMFSHSLDARVLTMRQLSRSLVALWCTANPTALALLGRILPSGLLQSLYSSEKAPKDKDLLNVRDNLSMAIEHTNEVNSSAKSQLVNKSRRLQRQIRNADSVKVIEKQLSNVMSHWKERVTGINVEKRAEEKVIVLRRRRQQVKSSENWDLFYYKFGQDHAVPNLIWNFKCREELRESIENEIRAFNVDKDLGQGYVIAWNHIEFEVAYNCLNEEVKIGEYYLRLLLESGNNILENVTKGLAKSCGVDEEKSEDREEEEKSELEIKNAIGFFNDLYHRFLLISSMKSMCLQAMTIVYTKCHQEIGSFHDTKYILTMLERTTDRLERDRLLMFIDSLILNKTNVKEIIDCNGIRTLVDLVVLAHLHTSRAYVPTQTNVIEASADMERDGEKEWYHGNKIGPYSFREMKELHSNGTIDAKTKCWSQGMDGWRTLDKIPQLKWGLLATGQACMNETSMTILILNMLIKMCTFYPSRDPDGAIIRPLPKVKRILSEAVCLPHVVQLLLTFDPIIVEKVATLLHLVVQDNPVLSRLYLTGVFFFISMYTGSNILPIARFLEYTHMKQAFRSDDSSEKKYMSDIAQRSILGHIYPEAMICYLENHGYEKFAQTYLGEFDTPEAIWNSEMRRHMIEKLAGHLAEFSPRLKSNTRALYQYCPIPIIVYPQLERELFCNIYYLRHLCDETRFGNWHIKDPVQLLKDCLMSWQIEVDKKPPTMSRDEAYDILEIKTDGVLPDESKIRKAYFKLAQKYHPDKNPDGREIFEKVNKAYEFLCSAAKLKDGPDPHNIALILKTQCILFERYSNVLMPFKYAGYAMLITTIRMETTDQMLFSKKDQLLSISCELAYQTIRCSALNAEELRRENGFELLNEAFSRCVNMLSQYSKDDQSEMSVQVCVFISKCFAAAAQFEQCRERILGLGSLIKDLCRCMYFSNLPKLCLSAAETISAFAPDPALQSSLHEAGALVHLLFYMFNYDFTLEEGGVERSDESNNQEIANNLARVSVRACARLAGHHDGFGSEEKKSSKSPDTNRVMQSLIALLTPYLAKNIHGDPSEILKTMNSNSRNPYLLWDNGTRAELKKYLEQERDEFYKKGESSDAHLGALFKYSVLEKELTIGDIYIRVYNEIPTFTLDEPKMFCIHLLDYLGSHAQYLYSILMNESTQASMESKLKNIEMALEALRNVIRHNDGVEVNCVGQFKLIFMLLRLSSSLIQKLTLEILISVTANANCVNDIANSDVLTSLLLVLHSYSAGQQLALECLYALCSNGKIVKDMIWTGGLLYVLNIFANSSSQSTRQKCAELFAKLLSDKLTGPKIRLILHRFLPPLFMDAMKDNAEAAVITFEGTYENPELIWNDDSRKRVCDALKQMSNKLYSNQAAPNGVEFKWSILDDLSDAGVQNVKEATSTLYSSFGSEGEIVISGVYIRLFISNPGWVLRRPKEFLTDLFEAWSTMCNRKEKDGDALEQMSQALVQLFYVQPLMLDNLPSMGVLPQVVLALSAKKDSIVGSAIHVVNQIVNNEHCLKSLSVNEFMSPMKQAMQRRADLVAVAAEAMNRIFSNQSVVDDFVGQALKCQMIEYLLKLLESSMTGIDKPNSVKAQIVKAIKSMLNSAQYLTQVESILGSSKIWKDYKDQSDDLFITNTTSIGYLTNSVPSVAGYLTAGGPLSINEKQPPPPEHDLE
ncbi:dnaJ -like protein, partial [Brachionus plicatilis]